jgi:hypothetical protein
MRIVVSSVLSGALTGLLACAVQHDVYTGHVEVASAELIQIAPGSLISVLADTDQPVFATDHAFWLYRDGHWYRADDFRAGPWVRIAQPPERLQRIARPMAYRHFLHRDDSAAVILIRHAPQ